MRRLAGIGVLLALTAPALAQVEPRPAPLLVVYGPEAPSREGDPDHVERLFISVPADLADRLYLRVFDPEPFGQHDTRYGRTSAATTTTFRLSGGEGAYSAAPAAGPGRRRRLRPRPRHRRLHRRPRHRRAHLRRGEPHRRRQWLTLAPLAAADGEQIDGRAWFRLDVIGAAGDTGNAFTVEASLSPDRSDPAPDARLFAYQPTVRWREGGDPTEVRFDAPEGAPLTLQSFDGAEGEIYLVSTFAEQRLPASGQDEWRLAPFAAPGGTAAITLRGGTETPNDVTLAALRPPTAARSPSRCRRARSRPQQRPVAVASARPLANCTSVAFDASASTGAGPLSFRWRFGDGAESDAPVIAHPFARPGRYEAELDVLGAGTQVARGARVTVPVHVRPAPVADAGEPVTAAPGEPVAFDGSALDALRQPAHQLPLDLRRRRRGGRRRRHPRLRAPRPLPRRAAGRGRERPPLRLRLRHPRCHGELPARRRSRRGPVRRPPARRVTLGGGASYDVDGDDHQPPLGHGRRHPARRRDRHPRLRRPRPLHRHPHRHRRLRRRQRQRHRHRHPHRQRPAGPRRPPAPTGRSPWARSQRSTAAPPPTPTAPSSPGPGTSATARRAKARRCSTPGPPPASIPSPSPSPTTAPPPPPSPPRRIDVTVSAAPVADAGPDQSVAVSEVAFDGGGSTDADGRITTWDWNFGDGVTASGRTVRHAYARPGTYEVALVVRDDSGAPLNTHRDTMTRARQRRAHRRRRPRPHRRPRRGGHPRRLGLGRPRRRHRATGPGPSPTAPRPRASAWRTPSPTPACTACSSPCATTTGLPEAFDVDEVEVAVNAPPVAAAGADLSVAPGAAGPPRRQRLLRPGRRHRRLALGLRRPRRARRSPPPPSAPGTPPASTPPSSPSPTRAAPPTPPPATR